MTHENIAAMTPGALDITMNAASAAEAADFERQQLQQRIASLEQRTNDLESNTVLSEPNTRVPRRSLR